MDHFCVCTCCGVQFAGFSERLSQVKIDIRRSSQHQPDLDLDETSSYFLEKLALWQDLDFTHSFVVFHREIQRHVLNLPLVLHNKDLLVKSLLKHILMPDCLARKSLLEYVLVRFTFELVLN